MIYPYKMIAVVAGLIFFGVGIFHINKKENNLNSEKIYKFSLKVDTFFINKNILEEDSFTKNIYFWKTQLSNHKDLSNLKSAEFFKRFYEESQKIIIPSGRGFGAGFILGKNFERLKKLFTSTDFWNSFEMALIEKNPQYKSKNRALINSIYLFPEHKKLSQMNEDEITTWVYFLEFLNENWVTYKLSQYITKRLANSIIGE